VEALQRAPRGTTAFAHALTRVDAADLEVMHLDELKRGLLRDAEIELVLITIATELRGRVSDGLLRRALSELEIALGPRAVKAAREWRARVRRRRRAA
jgi:hypothetical protein